MGTCCVAAPKPSITFEYKEENAIINQQLKQEKTVDKKVKKFLLLGAGSSGKSTIFRHWKSVLKDGFTFDDKIACLSAIRQSCVTGILILLKKSQQLYDEDPELHEDCFIDIENLQKVANDEHSKRLIEAIKFIVEIKDEKFDQFESFQSRFDDEMDDPVSNYGEKNNNNNEKNNNNENNNDNVNNNHNQVYLKQQFLLQVGTSLSFLWSLPQIKQTYEKRKKKHFSFCENMDYFFNRMERIFTWKYEPSGEDILKSRMRTTGVARETFYVEGMRFDIFDAGGQRSERKKWINAFIGVTAVLYVGALDHYAAVLFEDEETNSMIESLNIFYEILNSKWFNRTDIILFLNKEDIFDEYIFSDVPLSDCFNAENGCVIKNPALNGNIENHISYSTYRDFIYHSDDMQIDEMYHFDLSLNDKHSASQTVIPEYIMQNSTNYSDKKHLQASQRASLQSASDDYERQFEATLTTINEKTNDEMKNQAQTCEIYPNVNLRFSSKQSYCGGRYKEMNDNDWFLFVKLEYLSFIVKEYKSKNCVPKRHLFIHTTTATDKDKIMKLFRDLQKIIVKTNLTKGGMF